MYKILAITSISMENLLIVKVQKKILNLVAKTYPQVYLVPGCDTKLVFKYLDDEIIHKLNREYTGI